MGDKYFAITETTSMREINPVTLETGPRLNATDFVAVHTQTGHPHTDHDGTVYMMGTQFGRETNYCFYKESFLFLTKHELIQQSLKPIKRSHQANHLKTFN